MGIISGYSTNDMEPVLISLKALIRVNNDMDEWNYDEMSEEELDEELIDIWSLENNLIRALEEALDEINKYLTEISPNLAFDYYNKRLTGGWTINNLIQAMYFMLYVELSGGKILKHCGNETCTRYFPVSIDKVNAKYCSYECGQAQASREYRRREKNKRQGKIQ